MLTQSEYSHAMFDYLSGQKVLDKERGTIEKAMVAKLLHLIADQNLPGAETRTLAMTFSQVATKKVPQESAIIDLENAHHFDADHGGVLLTFIGETHDLQADTNRANAYCHQQANTVTCFVVERGLAYDVEGYGFRGVVIRETDVSILNQNPRMNWGLNLNIRVRSLLVAGYMALYLADTFTHNANAQVRMTILFGQMHYDIISYLKQLINSSATFLQDKEIGCVLVPSTQNPAENLLSSLGVKAAKRQVAGISLVERKTFRSMI